MFSLASTFMTRVIVQQRPQSNTFLLAPGQNLQHQVNDPISSARQHHMPWPGVAWQTLVLPLLGRCRRLLKRWKTAMCAVDVPCSTTSEGVARTWTYEAPSVPLPSCLTPSRQCQRWRTPLRRSTCWVFDHISATEKGLYVVKVLKSVKLMWFLQPMARPISELGTIGRGDSPP